MCMKDGVEKSLAGNRPYIQVGSAINIGDSGYVNNEVVQSTKALMAIFISYGVCSPSLRMRNYFVNIYSSRVQNPTVVGIVTWNSLLRILLIRNLSYSNELFGLF